MKIFKKSKMLLLIMPAIFGLGLKADDTNVKVVPTKCKVYLQINIQNNCSQMVNMLGNLDQEVALNGSDDVYAPEYNTASDSSQDVGNDTTTMTDSDNETDSDNTINTNEQQKADDNEYVAGQALATYDAPESDTSTLSDETRSLDVNSFSIEDVVRALPDICIGLVQDLDVRFEEGDNFVEAIVDFSKLEDKKLNEVGIHGNLNVGVSRGVLNLMVSTVKEMSKFRTPDAPRAIISVVALRTLPVPFSIDEKTAVVRNEGKVIRVTMQKSTDVEVSSENRNVEEAPADIRTQEEMQDTVSSDAN